MFCFYVGYWVKSSSFDILTWKMDAKRFEEACARTFARRKPLVHSATLEAPSSSRELVTAMIEHQSNRLTSSSRKKPLWKKRKAVSCSASPSSQEEAEVKLMDADERGLARKVQKVN